MTRGHWGGHLNKGPEILTRRKKRASHRKNDERFICNNCLIYGSIVDEIRKANLIEVLHAPSAGKAYARCSIIPLII